MASEATIFAAALEKAFGDERAAFLADACAGDARLRRRVEALLKAHAEPDEILDAPSPREGTIDYALITERSGSVIGSYKLLQPIGEGGMGSVWMAEQLRPVQRKVALKIMKPGMDSRPVLARFEAERQALALMDHPNIAKVLDGGATESGRPYFVMELVKGQPITKYCDEHRLTTRQRLELFVPVCQAIQHAHQKGIIHRDVKPSNVLVAPYDGKPVVKVIDFGVAKATGQRLTEQTLFTEFGAVIGTLEYMSPEQAELNNQDIDTRSDIYSLGVLLYELLTGSTPLERKRLKQAAFDEVLRLIREEDPPKPSTRLSDSKDSLPSISAQRQTEPARLTKLVRGELDWVVMKALDKDRNRRYETANGFARDVERYLADEAVQACPLSAGYRLRKFVQRNKGAVLAASLLLFSLLAGIAGTSWNMLRAVNAQEAEKVQRERAEVNEQKALDSAQAEKVAKESAETREAETKAVLDFVENKIFAAARPEGQEGGLGRAVTLRRAVDAALPFVEKSFHDQPLIEARLRSTLGTSFRHLGEPMAAAEQQEKARALFEQHRGPEHPATVAVRNNLALTYDDLGKHVEAMRLNEGTLEMVKARVGPEHEATLSSMNNLANSFYLLGRYGDALRLHEQILPLRKAKLGADHEGTFASMANLANCYSALGRHTEALTLREEVLPLTKTKFGASHARTLWAMHNSAVTLYDLGRYDAALKLFEETLELRKVHLGLNHPDTFSSMTAIGATYQSLGRHAEAVRINERLWRSLKAKFDPDHPRTLGTMHNLARSYVGVGRHLDACKLHEEVHRLLQHKLGPDHPQTLKSMGEVGLSYYRLGQEDEAVKLFEEVLAKCKEKLGGHHPQTLSSMENLAPGYLSVGRHADARGLHEDVLVLQKAHQGPDHPDTLWAMNNLAWFLSTASDAKFRDPPRAVMLAARAAELSPKTASFWGTLGTARYRAGEWKLSIADLQRSAGLRSADDPMNAYRGFFLAMAHWQLGEKDKAREWFEKAVQWMQKGLQDNKELKRFRAEAAQLLGIEDKS